jgi:hypothetical protein
MDGDELVRRLNCIAVNAIREAQVAKGRGELPWLDDDWRRMDMISRILDLHDPVDGDLVREHMPLSTAYQAPKNAALDGLGAKLDAALSGIDLREAEITDAVTQSPQVNRPKIGKLQ